MTGGGGGLIFYSSIYFTGSETILTEDYITGIIG